MSTSERNRVLVELDHHDPLTGQVLCDGITALYRNDAARHRGALALTTMTKAAAALRAALAL